MATKRQGFWKNYSKKVVEMTSSKHKKDPMDAFWCLNKALLDLYKVMDNKGGQKEVNRYCGYVLRFVVLLDTIALKDGDFNLDYSMDDPNLFDPLCKSYPQRGSLSQWNCSNLLGGKESSQQRRPGSLRMGEPGLHFQQGDLPYAGTSSTQGP